MLLFTSSLCCTIVVQQYIIENLGLIRICRFLGTGYSIDFQDVFIDNDTSWRSPDVDICTHFSIFPNDCFLCDSDNLEGVFFLGKLVLHKAKIETCRKRASFQPHKVSFLSSYKQSSFI